MQSPENHEKCIVPRYYSTLLYPNSNCYTKLRRNVAHVHRINGSLYFHTKLCNTIVEVPARLNLKQLVTVLPRQNFRPQLQRDGFKARCAKTAVFPERRVIFWTVKLVYSTCLKGSACYFWKRFWKHWRVQPSLWDQREAPCARHRPTGGSLELDVHWAWKQNWRWNLICAALTSSLVWVLRTHWDWCLGERASSHLQPVWLQCFKSAQSFFFRPTPLGFRQVVQHVRLHVAEMSELINWRKDGRLLIEWPQK